MSFDSMGELSKDGGDLLRWRFAMICFGFSFSNEVLNVTCRRKIQN